MSTATHSVPQIITFYSYKGGVGRSMAVANVGRLLARNNVISSRQTLLIDWDLEAPGLPSYFTISQPADRGLIEYFHDLAHLLRKRPASTPEYEAEFPSILARELPLDRYLCGTDEPELAIMTAGALNGNIGTYQKLVATFDWVSLFEEYPFAIQAFRSMLRSRFAAVLIDSRTGVSDTSGFCTALMPDKLVAVFGPNQQNLKIIEVVEAALEFRRMSDDLDPLLVFPLASRFDQSDLFALGQSLNTFQDEFTLMFTRAYDLQDCDLEAYFRENVLLYVPYYSYDEKRVAVESNDRDYMGSLKRAYETFTGWLTRSEPPWNAPSTSPPDRNKSS